MMMDAMTIRNPLRFAFSAPAFVFGTRVVGLMRSLSLLMMSGSGFVFTSHAVWSIASWTVAVKILKLISLESSSEYRNFCRRSERTHSRDWSSILEKELKIIQIFCCSFSVVKLTLISFGNSLRTGSIKIRPCDLTVYSLFVVFQQAIAFKFGRV